MSLCHPVISCPSVSSAASRGTAPQHSSNGYYSVLCSISKETYIHTSKETYKSYTEHYSTRCSYVYLSRTHVLSVLTRLYGMGVYIRSILTFIRVSYSLYPVILEQITVKLTFYFARFIRRPALHCPPTVVFIVNVL